MAIRNIEYEENNLLKELDECYTLCLTLDNCFVVHLNEVGELNSNIVNLKNELLNISIKMKSINEELINLSDMEMMERSIKVNEIEENNIINI